MTEDLKLTKVDLSLQSKDFLVNEILKLYGQAIEADKLYEHWQDHAKKVEQRLKDKQKAFDMLKRMHSGLESVIYILKLFLKNQERQGLIEIEKLAYEGVNRAN